MLNSLHVKNLALIEEAEVNFGKGLNILTGETGAGKSIIIGSINLALGAKADKDMIRQGKESALIELVFTVEGEAQKRKCREMEIELDGDTLVIVRKITAGKSLCRVNGETMTARQLKELAEVLIDVYGQHEHQSLTGKKRQFEILDDFCGEKLSGIKEKLSGEYKRYRELKKEWEDSDTDSRDREKEVSLLTFEIKEIDDARPEIGEDERLEADYRKMANARKLMEGVALVRQMLGGTDSEGILDMAGRAMRELKTIDSYDEALGDFTERLAEIEGLTGDICRDLADYEASLEFEPQVFHETQQRLDLLSHLKNKYGGTIEAVLQYKKEQEERLDKLANYDAYLEKLRADLEKAKKVLLTSCEKASKMRKKQASLLEEQMRTALHDLNFLEADFRVQVASEEEHISATGYDEVTFLISVNPGEPVKPLANVASGGELSRIILGLKTVMAKKGEIDTLIFDEIDAGISGRTAWQVSKKLAFLGSEHQIICITHLPQIAAMADSHFKIEKNQAGNYTRTDISILEEKESIEELARLLGSDLLTEGSLSNAKEMKELAANTKQY